MLRENNMISRKNYIKEPFVTRKPMCLEDAELQS